MKIINLISGPRNLSTALMYSFAQRADTKVLDEPFYGYYLNNAPLENDHPGQNEVLNSMELCEEKIVERINSLSQNNHVFVKGMAHHYLSNNPDFILNWENVILIRHPKRLIISFSKVIPTPTLQDIGIKKAVEIFLYLKEKGKNPIVIDSDELIKNPQTYLIKLCNMLEIPYSSTMLSWKKGGIPEDGNWAKHWYTNVHNSVGFSPQRNFSQKLPEHLESLLKDAMPYYESLRNNVLIND